MTRSLYLLATALVTSALGACAETPDQTDPLAPNGGGKADGELSTITFDTDWNETASGALVAGSTIAIDYDLDRLTECRGSTGGSDVWGVTGFASFDGGEAVVFGVSRIDGGVTVPVTAELDVPAGASSVAFWFEINNRWGCHAYDSNMSANYGFAIEQRAGTTVAAFEADYSESVSGPIRAGDQLVIHYATERLDECAGTYMATAAWGITGYYQVDGGAVKSLSVARADGPDLVPTDPEITVPRGSDLAVWFEATSRWGCHAYDSNLNANYHYEID
jgi:uncharacterized protein YraI